MEPFAIQCETCQARLKVRDPAAIGQILACPKCGSMVQVQAPPGWSPASDTPGSTGAKPAHSPAAGLDDAPTIRVPASTALGSQAADSPRAEPARRAVSDSSGEAVSRSTEAPDGEVDWSAPQRYWQRMILAGSVVVILLLGVAIGLVQRTRKQAASPRQPAQPPAQVAIDPAAVEGHDPAPAGEAGSDAAPSEPPAIDSRLIPPAARLLASFRFSSAPESAPVRSWFEYLYPLWAPLLGPVQETMASSSNRLTRFAWIALDLDEWDRAGLAVLEFQDRLPVDAPLVPESRALETRVAGAVLYAPPPGTWPMPYAVVGERTVVTGPEEILARLAAPEPSKPAEETTASESAAEESVVAETADAETGDAQPMPEPGDVANPDKAPAEAGSGDGAAPAPVEETPAAPEAPAAVAPQLLAGVSGAHDLALAIQFGDDHERIKSWLPGILSLPAAAFEQIAWDQVSAAALTLDCRESFANLQLQLSCASDDAAAQLEQQLRQQLPVAQERLAGVVAAARAAASTTGEAGDAALDDLGKAELVDTARIVRSGASLRIQAQLKHGLLELGLAGLRNTPAIDSVRSPAALALGEPQIANFARGLARGAEADQTFPAAAAGSAILPAEARLSWIATLLAYYGHEDWRDRINLARSWQDAENQPVTRLPLPAAINPYFAETITADGYPVTHYVGISGVGPDAAALPAEDPRAGVFGNQPRRFDAVRDGTSNTIAVMGIRERWGPWAAGGPSTVRPITAEPVVNGPDGFGTGQSDGMLVGMADGSVRFVSSEVDPRVVQQLATINGGESRAIAALEPVGPPKVEPQPKDEPATPAEPAAEPPPGDDEPAPAAGGGERQVDIAERLKDPIRALQVERMPLAQFLNLIDGLATLAIAIDFDQIGLPRAAQLPITIKVENTTVDAALAQGLAEHGLAVVEVDGYLVVRAQNAAAPAELAKYEVGELLAPPGSQPPAGDEPHPLVTYVQQLVAPATWAGAGGQGTAKIDGSKLVVEQTPLVQRQVADFVERLRAARGKSRLNPTEAQARLATPWTGIEPKLEVPLSVNFLDGTPLAQILDYLRNKTDIDFVVDWPALGAVRTGPDVLAGLHVQSQSLETALDSMLTPLGLAFHPIDDRTIQITTPAGLEASPSVEFYPLRPLPVAGDAGPKLLDRVRQEIQPEKWQGTPPAATAVIDPASRYLIVRGSSPLQREVGKRVQDWRTGPSRKKAP